jgi:hypothetical protein
MSVNWVPVKQSHDPSARLRRVPRARPVKARSAIEQVASRVRSEYLEMPGLCLTREQARCLWGLDEESCDQVLGYLLASGFLSRTAHGTYVRADSR